MEISMVCSLDEALANKGKTTVVLGQIDSIEGPRGTVTGEVRHSIGLHLQGGVLLVNTFSRIPTQMPSFIKEGAEIAAAGRIYKEGAWLKVLLQFNKGFPNNGFAEYIKQDNAYSFVNATSDFPPLVRAPVAKIHRSLPNPANLAVLKEILAKYNISNNELSNELLEL